MSIYDEYRRRMAAPDAPDAPDAQPPAPAPPPQRQPPDLGAYYDRLRSGRARQDAAAERQRQLDGGRIDARTGLRRRELDGLAELRRMSADAGDGFDEVPEDSVPGAADAMARQRAFIRDPENAGRPLPPSLAYVHPSDAPGKVLVPRSYRMMDWQRRDGTEFARPDYFADAGEVGYGGEAFRGFVRGANERGAALLGGGGGLLGEAVRGAGFGGAADAIQKFGDAGAAELRMAAEAPQFRPTEAAATQMFGGRWWAAQLPGTAQDLALMAAPGMGAVKAAGIAGASVRAASMLAKVTTFSTAAGYEAANAYEGYRDALIGKGMAPREARNYAALEATAVGLVNGMLEERNFGELFLKDHSAMNLLMRQARKAAAEGTTEPMQEAVNMLVAKLGPQNADLFTRQNLDQLRQAAALGAVTGAFVPGEGHEAGHGEHGGGEAMVPNGLDAPPPAGDGGEAVERLLSERFARQADGRLALPDLSGESQAVGRSPELPAVSAPEGVPYPAHDPAGPTPGGGKLLRPDGGWGPVPPGAVPPASFTRRGPAGDAAERGRIVAESAARTDARRVPADPTPFTPAAAALPAGTRVTRTIPTPSGPRTLAGEIFERGGNKLVRLDAGSSGNVTVSDVAGWRAAAAAPAAEGPAPTPTPEDAGVRPLVGGKRYTQAQMAGRKKTLRNAKYGAAAIIHGTTAETLADVAVRGIRPSGLSGRVDAERVGPDGRSVGTAIAYAGKGGAGEPVVLKLKPGVRAETSDGGANALDVSSRGDDGVAASDIESVHFADGTVLPLAEAVGYWGKINPDAAKPAAPAAKPAEKPAAAKPAGPPVRGGDTFEHGGRKFFLKGVTADHVTLEDVTDGGGGGPTREVARAAFESITGRPLDVRDPEPAAPKPAETPAEKPAPKAAETPAAEFHVKMHDGFKPAVEPRAVGIDGFGPDEFFSHRRHPAGGVPQEGYGVTSSAAGLQLATGDTRESAVAEARSMVAHLTPAAVRQRIDAAVAGGGPSPSRPGHDAGGYKVGARVWRQLPSPTSGAGVRVAGTVYKGRGGLRVRLDEGQAAAGKTWALSGWNLDGKSSPAAAESAKTPSSQTAAKAAEAGVTDGEQSTDGTRGRADAAGKEVVEARVGRPRQAREGARRGRAGEAGGVRAADDAAGGQAPGGRDAGGQDAGQAGGEGRGEGAGQKPVEGEAGLTPARPAGYGGKNAVVSRDRYEEVKRRLAAKLKTELRAGFDPELLALAAEAAAYHIEAGARGFIDYARAMTADFGSAVQPYLRSAYEGARAMPGMEEAEAAMDDPAAVKAAHARILSGTLALDGNQTQSPADAPAKPPAGTDAAGSAARVGTGSDAEYRPVDAPGGPDAGRADAGGGAAEQQPVLPGAARVAGGARPDAAAEADGRGAGGDPRGAGDGGAVGQPRRGPAGQPGEAAAGDGGRAGDGRGRPGGRSAGAAEDAGRAAGPDDGRVRPRGAAARVAEADLNHRIGPDDVLAPAGEVGKFKGNVAAVKLLKQLERDGRNPTPAEKRTLAQYVGWGGLAPYLDDDKAGRAGGAYPDQAIRNWAGKYADRHRELKELLTPAEWDDARRSTVNAHYTDRGVIEKGLWEIARRLGVSGGRFLENSAGVGHVIGLAPEGMDARWSAVEKDALSARIAAKLYPQANVQHSPYERAKLPDNGFDLTIGNVPFAKDGPADKRLPRFSLHNYFLAKSILGARPGGLVVEITTTSTLDGNASRPFREWASTRADFIGAVRLPNNAFSDNAGTAVTTDIVIYRKLDGRRVPSAASVNTVEQPTGLFEQVEDPATGRMVDRLLMVPHPDGRKGKDGKVIKVAKKVPLTFPLNEYFAEHPEMMLGKMEVREGDGLYAAREPHLYQEKGADLGAALAAAVARLPEGIAGGPAAAADAADAPAAPSGPASLAAAGAKHFSYALAKDGSVVQNEGGELVTPEWARDAGGDRDAKAGAAKAAHTRAERRIAAARDWLPIRDAAKALIAGQMDPDADGAQLERERRKLRERHEAFVGEHGWINDSGNRAGNTSVRFLDDDPEFFLTAALEKVESVPDPHGGEDDFITRFAPADILTRRTVFPRAEPTRVESGDVAEAATVSVAWRNRLDTDYIAGLLGRPEPEVRADLLARGIAYEDPDAGTLAEADEYLSGNVVQKLATARAAAAAEGGERYAANVAALAEHQPERVYLTGGEDGLTVKLGAGWVPAEVYGDFFRHLFNTPNAGAVNFVPENGGWSVAFPPHLKQNAGNTHEWGGGGMDATELLALAFGMKSPTVTVKGPEKARVVDPVATQAAQEAQRKLKEEFARWVAGGEHRQGVEDEYNRTHNNWRGRRWTPSPIKHYPGAAVLANPDGTEQELRPHQKAAVARGLRESYILGHFVGAGKTRVFVSTAMELRRLGGARKPLIVTQNATTPQIAEAFKELYPGANVLLPTAKDFTAAGRKRLFARIAAGDFDAVILPQSQFNMIEDDPERVRAEINGQIRELREAKERVRQGEGKDSLTVKEMSKAEEKLMRRLDAVADRRTDDILTFEQLGIDALIVDEAHEYKKNPFTTQMTRVRGLDSAGSQRAFSLNMKSKWVRERNAGKNVILATGTPVTNTLAEAWNMVRYVRPDVLHEFGVDSFDEFVNSFAEQVTGKELNDTGDKWREVTRLAKFVNLPELVRMFHAAADILDPSEVALPRPGLKGGEPTAVALERSPATAAAMDALAAEYAAYEKMSGAEKQEPQNRAIPLLINMRAKGASLDVRINDPAAPDDPGSKLNRAVADIHERWLAGRGAGTTQAVFADQFASSAGEDTGAVTDQGKKVKRRIREADRFNALREIKRKLVALGVPAKEVEVVSDISDKNRRGRVFEKVQKGEVRIVLGSTQTMGVGVNIQRKLATLHHLDAPWRPSDVEQREGRILRQGNTNAEVEVVRWGVQRTFDSSAFNRLAVKAKFINALLAGTAVGADGRALRTTEDAGEDVVASYQEASADLSGNPLLREKFAVESDLKRLRGLRAAHELKQAQTVAKVADLKANLGRHAAAAAAMRAMAERHLPAFGDPADLAVSIGAERHGGPDAASALDDHLKAAMRRVVDAANGDPKPSAFGNRTEKVDGIAVNGLEVRATAATPITTSGLPAGNPSVEWSAPVPGSDEALRGNATTGRGLVASVKGALAKLADKAVESDAREQKGARDARQLEGLVGKPFEREGELVAARRREALLDDQLAGEIRRQREGPPPAADPADAAPQDSGAPAPSAGDGPADLGAAGADLDAAGGGSSGAASGGAGTGGPGFGYAAPGPGTPSTPTPRVPISPLKGGTDKKLSQMIVDLGRGLDKPAVSVAKQGKGVVGRYSPGTSKPTIRFQGDLDTTAHEIAHYLDDKFGLGKPLAAAAPHPFDAELIPNFSSHGSVAKTGPKSTLGYRRAEGVAEWVRAWVVNPAEANRLAPAFAKHFAATVPAETRAAMQEFSKDVRRWAGMPAETRAMANVSDGWQKTWWDRAKERFAGGGAGWVGPVLDGLRTRLQDDLHPVMQAIKWMKLARVDLPAPLPEHDPAGLFRDVSGVSDKIAAIVEHGMIVHRPSSGRYQLAPGVGGGFDWLLGKDLIDLKDAAGAERFHRDAVSFLLNRRFAYKAEQMIADTEARLTALADRHLERMKAAGVPIPAGFDPLVSDPKLAALAGRERAKVRARVQRISGMGGGVFGDYAQAREAVANLLADPARAARVKELAARYEAWGDGILRYLVDRGRMTEASYRQIKARNDVYAATHRIIETIDPSVRREAGVSGTDPIKRFKGGAWMVENPYVNLIDMTAKAVRAADRNAAVDAFAGMLRSDRALHGGDGPMELDRIGYQVKPGDRDAVTVFNKGAKEHWRFEPGVHEALANWGQAGIADKLLSMIGKVSAQLPRFLITHGPGFVVRSAIREPVSRAVLSNNGSRPRDILTASTEEERIARRLHGGAQQQHSTGSAGDIRADMRRRMRQVMGERDSLLLLPGKAWAKYDGAVQEWGEQRNRDAEYRASFERHKAGGLDDYNASVAAARDAKELLDYLVAGSWTRSAMKLIPFLNSNIQGVHQFARRARADPAGVGLRWATYVVAPRLIAMALRAAAGQEDEYQKLPAWRRDFFINFKVGHLWLAVPSPFEAGVLGAGVERMLAAPFYGFDAKEYAGSIAKSLIPVDDMLVSGPVRGIIEGQANYSFFYDRSIIPPYEAGKDLRLRNTERASRLGRALQSLTQAAGVGVLDSGVDARKIDNFLISSGGSLSRLAMDLSDLGRGDRQPSRFLSSGVGLFTGPAAYGSKDVQAVMEQAHRAGDDGSREIRQLQALLKRTYTAKSLADYDADAARVRAYAERLRAHYDRAGEGMIAARAAAK